MTLFIPELPQDKTFFPDVRNALLNPDGLLALGGDLSPQRIFNAYNKGIFPWFSEGQPILWWSPSKRATLKVNCCHISKSMNKVIKGGEFSVTINNAFSKVIENCAKPRTSQAETWITDAMIAAYIQLHQQGIAHSLEVWQEKKLVGGLYGICVGTLFCGESMFSTVSNSSKLAFIALNQHLKRFNGELIDCQMLTPHLQSLGAEEISREQFINENLQRCKNKALTDGCWHAQQIQLAPRKI